MSALCGHAGTGSSLETTNINITIYLFIYLFAFGRKKEAFSQHSHDFSLRYVTLYIYLAYICTMLKKCLPSFLSISSFEPPSMATGVTRPPSHLPTSLYQLRTRLEGETTMALSISGLQSGLWRSSVHRRAMHCSVLPSPISSAMMQPKESGMRLPVTQSHRNFTP